MRQRNGAVRLVVLLQERANSLNLILLYKDLLSIIILLARACRRRCIMKKGREEKNWGYSVPLSLFLWNLPELRSK